MIRLFHPNGEPIQLSQAAVDPLCWGLYRGQAGTMGWYRLGSNTIVVRDNDPQDWGIEDFCE